MSTRLAAFLQVRPGEARMVTYVTLLFALVQAAQGIGANTADSLFFVRFGAQNLPFMFLLLGPAAFIFTVAYTAFYERTNRAWIYVASLAIFIVVAIVERATLFLDLPFFYPVLWISINVMSTILALQIWHVAGEVTDTRQAKRLYAIFISGGIFGSLVGNLATGALANRLGIENLIGLYAALLIAALLLTFIIWRAFFKPIASAPARTSIVEQLREGLEYERSSPMLVLLAYGAVVFAILYYAVFVPFSQIVSKNLSNAADLAGFLGLFTAAATAITFLISLLIANRLYARISLVSAVITLPIVYLAGFIVWAFDFTLLTAVLVRLAQLVILGGIMNPAWNALFNVAPSERRGEVLGFDAAVPGQIGVVLSGVLLLLGARVLTPTEIFGVGMVIAVVGVYIVWRMYRAYGEALITALRAGRFEIFTTASRTFARFSSDATAVHIATNALEDSKPSTRRLGAEILARLGVTASVPALVKALNDSDSEVRLAALRALADLDARDASDAILHAVDDVNADVRACALEVLARLEPPETPEFLGAVEHSLRDAEAQVRAQGAVVLAKFGLTQRAFPMLNSLLSADNADARVLALGALEKIARVRHANGANGLGYDIAPVVVTLHDELPLVRRAACETLGQLQNDLAIEPLLERLADPDATVRAAAAEALKQFGKKATPRVLQILRNGQDAAQEAALDALHVGDATLLQPLREYARREIEQARTAREIAAAIPVKGRVTKLACDLLLTHAAQSELRLVKTLGLLGNRESLEVVRKALTSQDNEYRAAAVEALETLGHKDLARDIIPLLDHAPAADDRNLGEARLTPSEALAALLRQRDSWTRAVAASAAVELDLRELIPNLRVLAKEEHDPMAREAALEALEQFNAIEPGAELQKVSSLERILLLREIPLFAELAPDELKRIADVAREQDYADSEVLCREGDKGNELFILAAGQVRVTKAANGAEKFLATRGVGEFIGEMAIVESAPRSATVRALGDVRALVIDEFSFKTILRERPEVALALLRGLSRRLREKG